MKRRYKAYLKINIVSLIFIVVSFISVTLAWFAYSGLSSADMEVNVKAWYIELERDGKPASNDIVISLDDIYPGMETVNETVKIKNLGDSDAQINYSITSARILDIDNYTIDDTTTSEYVEDKLSHDYPFHINISLSKNYILSKTDESVFNVSISWPLDSDTDAQDSYWGTEAYKFQTNENTLFEEDSMYQVRPSIKVVISILAEQYIETDASSDVNYNLGDEILYNVLTNSRCTEISDTCLKTNVIDVNSKVSDNTVTLLPDINTTYVEDTFDNYTTSLSNLVLNWNEQVKLKTRPLLVEDILNIVSTDINESFLIRNNMSDSIIGNLKYSAEVLGGPNKDIAYSNRIEAELAKAISYDGYYSFSNKYSYLISDTCYWTNSIYNVDKVFALINLNETSLKLYGELKTSTCKIVPVIEVNKENL